MWEFSVSRVSSATYELRAPCALSVSAGLGSQHVVYRPCLFVSCPQIALNLSEIATHYGQ